MKPYIRISILLMLLISGLALYGCAGEDTHDHDHSGETGEIEAADHDDHEGTDHADHDHTVSDDHEMEADHEHDHDEDAVEHDEHNHETEVIRGEEHSHDHEQTAGETIQAGGEWENMIRLETAEAAVMPIEMTLTVPGTIIPDQNKVAVVSPFIESSVNRVFVNVGDRVTGNTELACLASPEIGMMRAEYTKAQAEIDIKQQVFNRQERLFNEDIISRRAFEEAELALHVAEVDYQYARKRLLAVGLREDELDGESSSRDDIEGTSIHIHAPISGVITKRNAHTGQMVDTASELFEIMDLGTVWLEADIFEKDLAAIHIGQNVLVNVSAFEDEFRGTIFYIGSTLDEITKTIKILVEIKNEGERLKPGMYASTHIITGKKQDALVIPEEAVLKDENLDIVFVREGDSYHRHVVTTGIESGGSIEITDGLAPGDIVVTTGNFQLKSRLNMSGIDPHAGHNH